MNITSKCRCGAEFSIDFYDENKISSRQTFEIWLALHKECPSKIFAGHIPFKALLRKANEK